MYGVYIGMFFFPIYHGAMLSDYQNVINIKSWLNLSLTSTSLVIFMENCLNVALTVFLLTHKIKNKTY